MKKSSCYVDIKMGKEKPLNKVRGLSLGLSCPFAYSFRRNRLTIINM